MRERDEGDIPYRGRGMRERDGGERRGRHSTPHSDFDERERQ